jgi:hypothetical protein
VGLAGDGEGEGEPEVLGVGDTGVLGEGVVPEGDTPPDRSSTTLPAPAFASAPEPPPPGRKATTSDTSRATPATAMTDMRMPGRRRGCLRRWDEVATRSP